jgi:hypothetical protein
MENVNNDPTVEAVVETPVVEEAPVVEAPKVEEAPVEPVKEEVKVEEVKAEEPTAVRTNNFGRSESEPQALGSVTNGVMGVSTAPKSAPKKAAAKPKSTEDKVALHSTKNVTWEGVGKVYRGYNIVSQDAAEKWLTRSHIRTATPEEVAKEFGK